MLEHLPEEIRVALAAAQRREAGALRGREASRLSLHVGGRVHPILRIWEGGLALPAEAGGRLRGRVDVHDGSRHLFHCLITALREEAGEVICAIKHATPASDTPPRDYAAGLDPDAVTP
jgi:hypothetical protein